jgi:hypothetical protein
VASPAIHTVAFGPDFPSQGIIIDRAGYEVDASGWVWVLNHAVGRSKLNFRKLGFRSTSMLEAVAKFTADLIAVSSVDNVRNTFEALCFLGRSEHIRKVDDDGGVIEERLGPIADAFMGRIVRSEREAVNGDNPAKRIPWYNRHPDHMPEKAGNLGTCGSGPCGLFAPLSCYTCVKFQPWKDGPHREVLDWLCAERERKEKGGLDPQIVGIHDATILAVAEVVDACEATPA